MTRRQGGYLDSGRGSVRRSWGFLAHVSDAVRVRFAGSRVIVPSLALVLVTVAPWAAGGATPRKLATVAFAAYPFFHLWHRLTRTRH